MCSGKKPIGAAKGKQPNTEALCHPPPPPSSACREPVGTGSVLCRVPMSGGQQEVFFGGALKNVAAPPAAGGADRLLATHKDPLALRGGGGAGKHWNGRTP